MSSVICVNSFLECLIYGEKRLTTKQLLNVIMHDFLVIPNCLAKPYNYSIFQLNVVSY